MYVFRTKPGNAFECTKNVHVPTGIESDSNEDDGISHVEQKLSTVIFASKRL